LKELHLADFNELSHILIDEGALGSLEKLNLGYIPQLMMLPTGIKHLKKLEVLHLDDMSEELKQSIAPDEGKEHWIFNQVPSVQNSSSGLLYQHCFFLFLFWHFPSSIKKNVLFFVVINTYFVILFKKIEVFMMYNICCEKLICCVNFASSTGLSFSRGLGVVCLDNYNHRK